MRAISRRALEPVGPGRRTLEPVGPGRRTLEPVGPGHPALDPVGLPRRAAPAGAEQQGGGEQGDPAADAQPHARAGGLADPADGDAADGRRPVETSVRSDMTRPRIPGLDRSSTLVYNWL